MDKSFTEADLVTLLCETYEVDEATATKDIKNFIKTLRELNLIEDWVDFRVL